MANKTRHKSRTKAHNKTKVNLQNVIDTVPWSIQEIFHIANGFYASVRMRKRGIR